MRKAVATKGGDMNLKDKIEHKLKQEGIKHRFIPLPEDLAMDIAAHVKFHEIEMKDAVPTLIYRTEKGLIAVQRRADTKISESILKQVAQVKQLAFATYEEVESIGAKAGIVPLTGLNIPFFVDEKVMELPLAYGGGGIKTFALTLKPYDLVKINQATVGNFTKMEKSKKMLQSGKQRIVSGITPSGDGTLHIGNYLGAVKQFVKLAKDHDCFLFVADLHALTTIQNKKQLQKNVETLILNELSLLMGELGEDLPNVTFFRQSDVQVHPELQTILNNYTPLGLLKRAHAYKDKLTKDVMEDDISLGLFNYPVLMAADILMYKPDLVPVGRDQKQHIEITRDIAEKFNKTYKKELFKLPEAHIPEEVAVIVGTDGKRKMSKSLGNLISIFEDEKMIKKQVMSAYTDPTRKHADDKGRIEGNMVFHYLDHFGEKEKVDELKNRYREGKVGDVEVKEYLYEQLMKTFKPARKHCTNLQQNPKKLQRILQEGAEKARAIAMTTMNEVRETIGLTNKHSFFEYAFVSHVVGMGDPGSESGMTKEEFGMPMKKMGMTSGVITFDEFAKVEMRVGKVVHAENLENSDKLIKLTVDVGEKQSRTILTGVRPYGYKPDDFQDKQFFFITNLESRKMRGSESQGMILAVDDEENKKPIFVSASGMPVGAKIR